MSSSQQETVGVWQIPKSFFCEYAVVNTGSSSRYNLGANRLQTIANLFLTPWYLIPDHMFAVKN
jgi:hypothetical protein